MLQKIKKENALYLILNKADRYREERFIKPGEIEKGVFSVEVMKASRAFLVESFHKMKEKDDEKRNAQKEAIQRIKEEDKRTVTVRKGNRVYRRRVSTGAETLIGVYIKTPSGREVFRAVTSEAAADEAQKNSEEVLPELENYTATGKIQQK